VAGAVVGALLVSWLITTSWAVVVAVGLAALVVTPALVVLFFDRSSR